MTGKHGHNLIGHKWRWTHVRDGWGWAPAIALFNGNHWEF